MEIKMAEAVGRRIGMMAESGRLNHVMIYPEQRKADGWLEWLIVYTFTDGGQLTVGAIQRHTADDEVEFHS